ncbi:GerAB/ArcD/ProY family transporter [Neobacillus muris]|uniref:GerAB/ArcD/ProY family transporter n=1 Tax=Neobacillus muris TaxID=2941334 RepID=UPI00203B1CC8|nr:endospore germination permease [Neobacillus muris]
MSQYQLFALTLFFQIGTTIIFGFGASAGKDAWIAAIVSTVLGILAVGTYLILMYLNPGLTLVEWFPAQLGKWIGTPIAWLYPFLFLYELGRVLNDIKYMLQSLIFPDTPFLPLIVPFLLILAYGQLKGIEVLGRVGELILPIFLFLFIILAGLIWGSNILAASNLRPILEAGWLPIFKASFPLGASQGFAQSIELAMIWTLTKGPFKTIAKINFAAVIASGLIILASQLMLIMGLGEFNYQTEIFPMYILIRKIRIGNFIQNLDLIGVMFMMITAFFKASLHMFFAIRSIQLLTKIEDSRKLLLPVILLGLYLGYSVSSSITQHLKVALEVFPHALWIPLLWVLPFLLIMITIIKKTVKHFLGANTYD